MQGVDRELFLELTESPVNPAFVHMSSPLVNGYDRFFYLQINGEVLWKWRELKMDSTRIFHALQDGLDSIGYRLNCSCQVRVGAAVKGRVQYVMKKMNATTNGDSRKRFRSEYWAKLAIYPEEILTGPQGIIEELKRREEQLIEQCKELRKEVEGKNEAQTGLKRQDVNTTKINANFKNTSRITTNVH